jgi:hypothetical protein
MMGSMAAVAQQLAEAFEAQAAAARLEPLDASTAIREGYVQALAHVVNQLADLAAANRQVESLTAAFLSEAEERLASGTATLAELDSIANWIEERETLLATRLLPMINSGADRDVFRLPREFRARHVSFMKNRDSEIYRALEFLRDARWRVLAMRAEIDQADESPAFDDAEALGRYLDSL